MLKREFIDCFSCMRNYVKLRSLLTFVRLTCIIHLGCMLSTVSSSQCSDTTMLKKEALSCFRAYDTQKIYVDRSDQRLFSGIDIETLRAYCSSYREAIMCVSKLVSSCPKTAQQQVEEALVNYNGIQEELTDLCTTQKLYELYAQYMNCYAERGQKSDWCYESKLNNSIQNIYKPPTPEFCSLMEEATSCIENNIRSACGEQATELVHLLVKPTVPGSAHCKYNIIQENTPQTMKTEGGNGGRKNHQNERATSSDTKNSQLSTVLHSSNIVLLVICLYISLIANFFKPRGLS